MPVLVENDPALGSDQKLYELIFRERPVERDSDGTRRKDGVIGNKPFVGILTDYRQSSARILAVKKIGCKTGYVIAVFKKGPVNLRKLW